MNSDGADAQQHEFARYEKLDCGVRVCVVEERSRPLVSVQLWFDAGSANDPRNLAGLTMLVHRLVDEQAGTTRRALANGLRARRETLRDASFISLTLPPEALAFAIESVAGQLRELRCPPTQIRAAVEELLAIQAERGGLQEAARLRLATEQALLKGHPYENHPESVEGELLNRSTELVSTHWERWFSPSGATLLVVGDVDTESVVTAARAALKGVGWRDAARKKAADLPVRADLAAHAIQPEVGAGDHGPFFDMAWLTGGHSSRESLATRLLLAHLTNPVDGPLAASLKARGLNVTHQVESFRDTGIARLSVDRLVERQLAVQSRAPPLTRQELRADIEFIRAAIHAAIRRIGDSGCDPESLIRARAELHGSVVRRMIDFDAFAGEVARTEILGGDALMLSFLTARIRALDVGDLQRAAIEMEEARLAESFFDPAGEAVSSQPVVALGAVGSAPSPLPVSIQTSIDADLEAMVALPPRPGAASRQKHWRFSNSLPGFEIVAAEMPGVDWLAVGVEVRDSRGLYDGPQRLSEAQYADYLSFHGIEARDGSIRLGPRARTRHTYLGRPLQREALIELARDRVARTEAAGSSFVDGSFVRIVAVGGVTADELQAALEFEWKSIGDGWPRLSQSPATQAMSDEPGGVNPPGGVLSIHSGRTPRTFVGITFVPGDDRGEAAKLVFAHLVPRLLGAAAAERRLGEGEGRLTTWSIHHDRQFSVYFAGGNEAAVLTALTDAVEQLTRLARRSMPSSQLSALFEIARREAWGRLGDADAFTGWIFRARSEPWSELAAPIPEDLPLQLSEYLQSCDVRIELGGPRGFGGLAKAREILSRFRSPADETPIEPPRPSR